MPWDSRAPNLGFTTGEPWLPLGPAHKSLAVSEQEREATSVLQFARSFLEVRKAHACLRLGEIAPVDTPPTMLAYVRTHEQERMLCLFNLGREPARYRDPRVAGATPIFTDCGKATESGDVVELGPLSGWFGRF